MRKTLNADNSECIGFLKNISSWLDIVKYKSGMDLPSIQGWSKITQPYLSYGMTYRSKMQNHSSATAGIKIRWSASLE